ncbi:unnamed protein product [Diamesa hyperborea]
MDKQAKTDLMTSRKNRATRSKLTFPVATIHGFLKKRNYAKRIRQCASVYYAAFLEYLTAETMELSGNAASDFNKRRILLGIQEDYELNELLKFVTIAEGGVVPHVYTVLLPNNSNEVLEEDPEKY